MLSGRNGDCPIRSRRSRRRPPQPPALGERPTNSSRPPAAAAARLARRRLGRPRPCQAPEIRSLGRLASARARRHRSARAPCRATPRRGAHCLRARAEIRSTEPSRARPAGGNLQARRGARRAQSPRSTPPEPSQSRFHSSQSGPKKKAPQEKPSGTNLTRSARTCEFDGIARNMNGKDGHGSGTQSVRVPLVEGHGPAGAGRSRSPACRARANPLKHDSAMWWSFTPYKVSTWIVIPALIAKA